MIYIKCLGSQIDTIVEKARVRVRLDQKTIDYIDENPQDICLQEVADTEWLGRKFLPDKFIVVKIGEVIGKRKPSKTNALIAERNLTKREIEEKKEKRRNK